MIKRVRYLFRGIVQGVGFRPFIYRLAVGRSLGGFVQNRAGGVVVEVEGGAAAIDGFLCDVQDQLPPHADIAGLSGEEIAPQGESVFQILASGGGEGGGVHIPADTATCPDCLRELFDPQDRRYRYPFINCTNCGPRLTIIGEIPYDRANTSMSCFPLCSQCRKEYEDPADRRFHAEPNACPACGPSLRLLEAGGRDMTAGDPVAQAAELLRGGSILALKGLGGFHLAVDAANHEAVSRLRSRKFREEKPLALMVRDVDAAARLAEVGGEERDRLLSPERPIVLARKKEGTFISPAVAPGVPDLGLMLPYTPLHHLLLAEGFFIALVMTSANQVDEPICIGNREALERLKGIADFFLMNNRDILVRCDDSIVAVSGRRSRVLRRSRGYAPKPLFLRQAFPEVLALGPQLKATLCIVKGNAAFLSPHIGDMETPQARDFYRESLAILPKIAECSPGTVACDLHPGYYTTRVAEEMQETRIIRVQHHHAHIVSCLAENGISGPVIGLAMDGTGYGSDGTVWGGEFLAASEESFERAGRLRLFRLPGGEKAIREPWRIGAALLRETYGPSWLEVAAGLKLLPEEGTGEWMEQIFRQGINSPLTSSLGRLFDGVASLLGLRRKVSFEGQAAMAVEALAVGGREEVSLSFGLGEEAGVHVLDFVPLVAGMVDALGKGRNREAIAVAFHRALSEALTAMAGKIREETGLRRAVLSGGCFQNRVLLEGCIAELEKAGFDVYTHRQVPTNDGGISLGQAVSAAARIMKNN